MASAMTGMVTSMKIMTEEQEFKQTMERRLEEDPSRLEAANAAQWTHYEVASWIEQMRMERYARYFAHVHDQCYWKVSNLGVRTIHAKKRMREIYALKKAVCGVTGTLLDDLETDCAITDQRRRSDKRIN
eukprot:2181_1